MGTASSTGLENFVSPFDGPVVVVAKDEKLLLKGSALPADPNARQIVQSVSGPKTGLKRYHRAELTSAMQKYVRRGEVGKACAVARAMMEMDPETQIKCIRRLPVIGGEDGGWPMVAPTTWAWKRCESLLKEGNRKLATQLAVTSAGILAKNLKSGDVLALWSVVMRSRRDPKELLDETWPQRLLDALKAKDEETAARISLKASKVKATKEDFWRLMRHKASGMSFEVSRLVESSALRLAAGVRGCDEGVFVAGAILGICRYTGIQTQLLLEDDERAHEMESIDWYVMDIHTWVGKRAAIKIVQMGGAEGLTSKQLNNLWFYMESLKGKYDCQGDKWFAEAVDWELKHICKIDGGTEQARELWEKIAPRAEETVIEEMRKGGKA